MVIILPLAASGPGPHLLAQPVTAKPTMKIILSHLPAWRNLYCPALGQRVVQRVNRVLRFFPGFGGGRAETRRRGRLRSVVTHLVFASELCEPGRRCSA